MTLYSIVVEAPDNLVVNHANVSVLVDPDSQRSYQLKLKLVHKVTGYVDPVACGPREIIDPEYDTFGGPRPVTFKAGLHPETLNPMPLLPKHENITDRLDEMSARMRELQRQMDGFRRHLAKSDEEAALNLTATDTRLDRLSGILDEHEKAVVDINDRLDRFFTSKAAAPRTIKGGWVNVYETGRGVVWNDMPWTTKEGADTETPCGRRIACIRIPDFTEGDGL